MYQHLLAAEEYDSAAEYDALLAFAREEYEDEMAREEYAREQAMLESENEEEPEEDQDFGL